MRVMFGLLGLVVTLFLVMQLVKMQTATLAPAPVRPTDASLPNANPPAPQGNPKQVQEQYQQALDGALKAATPQLTSTIRPPTPKSWPCAQLPWLWAITGSTAVPCT